MNWMQNIRDGAPIQRRSSRYEVNWLVFFLGQLFWLVETAHFGWNFTPKSDAEIVCDGIAVLITALSIKRRSQRTIPE